MNKHVFLLFFNAFFAVLIGVFIVARILWKEYRPVIREKDGKAATNQEAE